MKLVIAADHGGVELKDLLVKRLGEAGHEVEDLGTHGSDSVDYPDFAFKAARKVSRGEVPLGILVCGTGIGMSIAANKVRKIRCAHVCTVEQAKLAAEHNHANMLALGGRTTDEETAWEAVQVWLQTPKGGDRHKRRVDKIDAGPSDSE
ncbi:RpiB/LacA/LacB family sugar-phosphate isomerase [bacterium]|nr:RpiB/LacA/LacB family sugar-phosphate isomerase [bacterium]